MNKCRKNLNGKLINTDVLQGGEESMQLTSVQKQNELHKYKGGFNMFQLMKKRIKNEKGLTLVEVLAVVVILAIVAAIAIPAISNMIEKNRAKALVSDAINVMNAANIYFTDGGKEASITADELYEANYLESYGNLDATSSVAKEAGEPIKITASGTNGNVKLEKKEYTLKDLTEGTVTVKEGKVVVTPPTTSPTTPPTTP